MNASTPVIPLPLTPPIELKRRSVIKTISWRTIGSIDTMCVSFMVFYLMHPSGPASVARSASLVGIFEVPNKLLLYYLHERVWSRLKYGLVTREPEYEI